MPKVWAGDSVARVAHWLLLNMFPPHGSFPSALLSSALSSLFRFQVSSSRASPVALMSCRFCPRLFSGKTACLLQVPGKDISAPVPSAVQSSNQLTRQSAADCFLFQLAFLCTPERPLSFLTRRRSLVFAMGGWCEIPIRPSRALRGPSWALCRRSLLSLFDVLLGISIDRQRRRGGGDERCGWRAVLLFWIRFSF